MWILGWISSNLDFFCSCGHSNNQWTKSSLDILEGVRAQFVKPYKLKNNIHKLLASLQSRPMIVTKGDMLAIILTHVVWPTFNGGRLHDLFPWKITRNGKHWPLTDEDIAMVTWCWFSILWTFTCWKPFVSHVLMPPIGTICILIWSMFTTNS